MPHFSKLERHKPAAKPLTASIFQEVKNLLKTRRLAGDLHDGLPEFARGVHLTAAVDDKVDGHVDIAAVPPADQHGRLARHGGVHGVLGQPRTVNIVLSGGRDAANGVARVNVFEGGFNAQFLKVGRDPIPQINADIFELLVAGGVHTGLADEILARALGHDDNGVFAQVEPGMQMG